MRHLENRRLFEQAWEHVFGVKGTRFEVSMVHAVGELETSCGDGWKGAGKGSNNMGADQAPGCPSNSFEYVDTHPNPDGTSTPYRICFRKYPTKLAGAIGLVNIMAKNRAEVRKALRRGSELAVSATMWLTSYYEGFGADEDDRIVNHYLALMRNARKIALALNEPVPVGAKLLLPPESANAKPTLRFGVLGEKNIVKEWQRIIGVAADGIFGRETERATKEWQQARGLVADGVVGPRSWSKALEEVNTETLAA